MVVSTLKGGETRPFVGFIVFDESKKHHDLGAVKDDDKSSPTYLFTRKDADAAQRILVTTTERGAKPIKQVRTVIPAPQPVSEEDFMKNTMQAMLGEEKDDDVVVLPNPKPTEEKGAWPPAQSHAQVQQQQTAIQSSLAIDGLRQEIAARDQQFNAQFQRMTSMLMAQQGQQAQAMQAMQATQHAQRQPVAPIQHNVSAGSYSMGHQHPTATAWSTGGAPSAASQPGQAWQGGHSGGVIGGLNAGYKQLVAAGTSQWGWSPPQMQQQQQQQPQHAKKHEAAVVVFGTGDKKGLKEMLSQLSPTAAAAIEGAQQVMTGAPRFLLLAKASNVQLVQTLVPLLISRGLRAANYKSKQTGQAPKSQAAMGGLQAAAGQGGVCRYFATGTDCPFAGRCKFICKNGPPRQ
jgi:hypothetical protein